MTVKITGYGVGGTDKYLTNYEKKAAKYIEKSYIEHFERINNDNK